MCLQEAAEVHKENIRLRQRCNAMESEIRALRYDLTAMQRHLHLPVSMSAMGVEEESTNYRRKKSQVCSSPSSRWLQEQSLTKLIDLSSSGQSDGTRYMLCCPKA